MENINALFILQPLIVIVISAVLMAYWYYKRRFHLSVWLFSLIAYFGAIGLKYLVQLPTVNYVISSFGASSIATGLYYGMQTVVFEVGLAFLVAWYAVKHHKLESKDAEAYSSGLAFWENAVFLGALSLINLVTYYFILTTNGSIAQTLYDQLNTAAPTLFASNNEALGLVAIGVVERISSLLFHVAWGYLCFMAVLYHKKYLFLIALPMGLVDFLVPFAQLNVLLFETVVFVLAVASVFVAWYTTRNLRGKPHVESQALSTQSDGDSAVK
jgi:hypothetical protein